MIDPEDAWLLWKPPQTGAASFHDVFVAGFHAALAAQPDDADGIISAKWSSLRWRANEELAHSEPPDVARVARMAYEAGARDGLAASAAECNEKIARAVERGREWGRSEPEYDRIRRNMQDPAFRLEDEPPADGLDVERWLEAVSDSLAATTMGTDYAEAPEPSDEPGSPYVRRLTNELLSRLHPAVYAALAPEQPE